MGCIISKFQTRISAKGETLDKITDKQLAAYISTLDTQGIAPNTLSVILAAIKWYFSNVKGSDVQFTISQNRSELVVLGFYKIDIILYID